MDNDTNNYRKGHTVASQICVVIPAYNASKTINDVVTGALKHVSHVIVADDGSTDDTAETARRAGADVVTISRNRGKGHVLKILFQKSIEYGFDAVITIDADGQHDPEEIPSFIDAHNLHPRNIIVGSRMHEQEKIPRARYNSMHIARFYISLAANQFIDDTQCGYRLYPLSLINELILTTEKYITETEILIKAGDMGTVIRCIDSKAIYTDNGSHYRPVLDTTAITAFVLTYLIMKWFKEGFISDRPFTYTRNNIMNLTGKHKLINTFFQAIIVVISIPVCSLYFIEYLTLQNIVKNNFASLRRLNIKFSKIVRASYMLPFVLIIIIGEKAASGVGIKIRSVDGFIKRYYPDLWSRS
jgi:glycosyltransferase involved in cell wall biosynthesis